jgi:hypothetical protein
MSVSILVVDDEPDVAELFRQRFRREARDGTYVMHFANSGENALQVLGEGIEPQLIVILSDINMPGMDGATIARGDQAALSRLAGDDGDRLRRRRAPAPRKPTRGLRVPHQAGGFRPVEEAVAPVPHGSRVNGAKERPNVRYLLARPSADVGHDGLFGVDLRHSGRGGATAAFGGAELPLSRRTRYFRCCPRPWKNVSYGVGALCVSLADRVEAPAR